LGEYNFAGQYQQAPAPHGCAGRRGGVPALNDAVETRRPLVPRIIPEAGLLQQVTFPGLGDAFPLVPSPIELPETPGSYRRPAPLLGEHTDEILRCLGCDDAEIAGLRRDSVV
jgi:hypothetical protein